MNIPPSAMQPGENDDFVTDLDSQQRLRKSLELSQRIHVINSQRSIVSNVKCLDRTPTTALSMAAWRVRKELISS
jgi:hypothetical protein